MSVLTYIMPPLLHAKLVTEPMKNGLLDRPFSLFGAELIPSHLQLVFDRIYLSLGLFFFVFSTAQSGYDIYQQIIGQGSCSHGEG